MTFKWPWPKVKAVALINKNFHDAVITTHSVTRKLDSYIILVMLITWLNCGWIMLETFLRILDFFIVKHTMVLPWEWLVLLTWNKEEFIGWILGHLCDLDLWPWPWIIKGQIWYRCVSGMGGPIDMEQKAFESIIHDHDWDLCLTMLGYVDVWDSDWGDFRHQCAIDISSFAQYSWFTDDKIVNNHSKSWVL